MQAVRLGGQRFRVEIEPLAPLHVPVLAEILVAVQLANPVYPSRRLAEPTSESMAAWLTSSSPSASWVALSAGTPVGHVAVQPLPYYIADGIGNPSGYMEISRLFVSPIARGLGIGHALLDVASENIHELGFKVALCVLDGSKNAVRIYEQRYGCSCSFDGLDGLNHIFVERES